MEEQQTDQSPAPRWGEFPPQERQDVLKNILDDWEQKSDHIGRAGPFAGFKLTGADVFWLAARAAGKGNVAAGRQTLTDPYMFLLSGLPGLHLEGANLGDAQLQGANLSYAQLQSADLTEAQLQDAFLSGARLQGAKLAGAQLQDATLTGAHLQGAILLEARLQGAFLIDAMLQDADLSNAGLEGAEFTRSDLRAVEMRGASLDAKTRLTELRIDAQMRVADVLWNGASLIQVDWEQAPRLGDEAVACQAQTWYGELKNRGQWLAGYQAAARAYRQLAVALRGQGITEAADRFTYRALIMQHKALWWQIRNKKFGKLGAYLFSAFLAALTGYGFRMWRIIAAYALIVLAFAAAYWGLGFQAPPGLSFWQAIIVSVTAFHGRVFANPFTLNEPQIAVTALEAIFGLVIEGVFIAMLTQRFFSR